LVARSAGLLDGPGPGRPARSRRTHGGVRQPAGVDEGPAEQELDLRVAAPELLGGPPGQRVVDGGVQPQQDALALGGHGYSVPTLTTGCIDWSLHRATSRFATIAARRSSSSTTTSCSSSRASACSTMPTAPSTIRWRAATMASACCRRSSAWATSGAY